MLLGIDLEEVFKADPYIPISANQLLFEHTGSLLGEPDQVTSAVWFHATRTAANNQFLEGILPLNIAFPADISMLADAAPCIQVRSRLTDWGIDRHGVALLLRTSYV